jgi:DNA-binding GntR family transcriptional regulator
VTKRPSSREIFETLAARISACEFASGTRLTEERLSEEFGVSRSPIREALRLLEQAGHVERAAGRGYAVRALDLVRINDIYTVRVVLEELSIELAAGAVGSREFDDLRERTSAALSDDGQELREQFHEDLARLGNNVELVEALAHINSKIYAVRRLDSMIANRSTAAQREHVELLDLLARGAVLEAKAAMREHIRISQSTVRSLMDAGVATISFATPDRQTLRAKSLKREEDDQDVRDVQRVLARGDGS